jgi:hypothetical protein
MSSINYNRELVHYSVTSHLQHNVKIISNLQLFVYKLNLSELEMASTSCCMDRFNLGGTFNADYTA